MSRMLITINNGTLLNNGSTLPAEGASVVEYDTHTHMTIAHVIPRGCGSYRVCYIDRRPELPYYPPFVLDRTTVADALEQITAHELLQGE